MILGALLGLIGAAAYVLVSPWLIGPHWFRAFTVGATAGMLVGAMVIHPDGVDFQILEPTWLAVATFVAVPAVFGFALVYAVDAVASPSSWTARGHARWAVPARRAGRRARGRALRSLRGGAGGDCCSRSAVRSFPLCRRPRRRWWPSGPRSWSSRCCRCWRCAKT